MMFPVALLVAFHFILIIQPKLTFAKVSTEEVKAFVEEFHKGETEENTITYNQLEKWFDSKQKTVAITQELYPRLFPFCVTYEQVTNFTHLNTESSHLARFEPIFQRIKMFHDEKEKFYHFEKSKHSIVGNKEFIKKVTLSRITTPEMDMINLRQWVHVKVETTGLVGLYVQSITGPVGLPVGEFSVEFPCADHRSSEDIDSVGELQYCHYRPKANIYHPKVYVAYSSYVRNVFHLHFSWTDITCMETPYLQFVMIAVKDFKKNSVEGKDYQLVFSPVFLNTAFDSQDGSPYPYYPTWRSSMYCSLTKDDFNDVYAEKFGDKYTQRFRKVNGDHDFAEIGWKVAEDVYRIQPNEEYDACIRGAEVEEVLSKKDDARLECPPGPFQCTESYANFRAEEVKDLRQRLVNTEKDLADCFPCAAPPCIEIGFTNEECGNVQTEIITKNDTNVLERLENVARVKSHGVLSSLACLVLLPIANYLGRHFKETCRNCMCGNGPWIYFHIILHISSCMFMWISIGPVIATITSYAEVLALCEALHSDDIEATKECAVERSMKNPHVPLGILVVLCQNFLVAFGFFRSSANTLRNVQVILHSHFGYLTFILAGLAALIAVLNNRCAELAIFVGVLLAVPIVFFIIGCVLDILTDKKIGITPIRKQWPVLEPIKLDRRGPFEPCKCCVFVVYVICTMVIWFMVVASSKFSAKNNEPTAFDPDRAPGLAEAYKGTKGELQGLLGVCGSMSEPEKST